MNFDDAFLIVIGEEGGYSNDPTDPGGETKYGISHRAYPSIDIKNLTLDQAKAIYHSDYWSPLGLDAKPWAVALLLFDTSVNQGRSFAQTLPADPVGIAAGRALRYASNPNLYRFGKGWFNRLFTIFQKATSNV